MKTPIWLKPALYGAAAGAVALSIIGFSWGGWVTGGTAKTMATNQARLDVVAALVPICVQQSKLDPKSMETLGRLKEAQRYERDGLLISAGWATMPGSNDANQHVASACMKVLAAQF